MTDEQYKVIIKLLDNIIADQRAMIETLKIPTRKPRKISEELEYIPDELVDQEIEQIQLEDYPDYADKVNDEILNK